MEIQKIKDLAAREGDVQIIVTFLDEEHITVGVKIIKPGFARQTFGDFEILGPEAHTEQAIRGAAEGIIRRLDDSLKEAHP